MRAILAFALLLALASPLATAATPSVPCTFEPGNITGPVEETVRAHCEVAVGDAQSCSVLAFPLHLWAPTRCDGVVDVAAEHAVAQCIRTGAPLASPVLWCSVWLPTQEAGSDPFLECGRYNVGELPSDNVECRHVPV